MKKKKAVQKKEKQDRCPDCGHKLELGYGLAGGGIGVYLFCNGVCQAVKIKHQDPDV